MNILMLTSIYPQPDDGEYKVTPTVQYFCRQWVKSGHNVIVVHNNGVFPKCVYMLPKPIKRFLERRFQMQIPSLSTTKRSFFNDGGVLVYRMPMAKIKLHGRFSRRKIKKQGLKILNILGKNDFKPDLIIGHWANPQAELISWIKKNYSAHYATAIVFHSDFGPSSIKRYNLGYFIKDIDVIGCRNIQHSYRIKELLNLDYIPFVCNSGLDNSIVASSDIVDILRNKDFNHILYVGRLVKYKNVDSIIKALSTLERGSFDLKIIGDGTEKEALSKMVKSNNLQDCVSFLDRIPHIRVFEEMKKSGIFVMISKDEVFGMVYLEAMIMGCIVVASRGSAFDGIIENGINGFLCGSGDDEELCKILSSISNMGKDALKSIAMNAYKTAINYTDENVSSQYIDNVFRILNNKETL